MTLLLVKCINALRFREVGRQAGMSTSAAWTADWDTDATERDMVERYRPILSAAWLIIRGFCVAVIVALSIAGPLFANVAQALKSKSYWWVFPAILSALMGPALFGVVWSRNSDARERIGAALLLLCCYSYDLYNGASNHSATSDAERQAVVNIGDTQENTRKERERLDREYETLFAKEAAPVATLEADLEQRRSKNPGLWGVSMQCTHVTYSPKWPGEARFCADYAAAKGRLETAKARDKAKDDRQKLGNAVHNETSAAGSKINNTEVMLAAVGITDVNHNHVASAISWATGWFMVTIGIVAPHFAFIYLFRSINPKLAERRRLERERARAVRKAEKEALREGRRQVYRERKQRAVEFIKARFKKRPPVIAEPEPPAVDLEAEEEIEAETEPPVQRPRRAPKKPSCGNPTIAAFNNQWLQEAVGVRTGSKEMFEGPWTDFCLATGHERGTQTKFTRMMNASGLYETYPNGRGTWFCDVTIKPKNVRPKLRVV